MRLLMIHCSEFTYFPTVKTLDEAPDVHAGRSFKQALVAFIQAEEQDEKDIKSLETKMVKNLKWAAKKNGSNLVVLHSFAHLSDSKAGPEFTRELFNRVEARMKNADYECCQTAFGYFMDLDLSAPGVSQARISNSF